MTSAKPASSSVKSATRVFQVFELFAHLRIPLTVSDIARELDLPISSALMLLRSIVDAGYLTVDERRKAYFPTPRLAHLTSWIDYSIAGTKALTPLLEDLRRVTGETVVLAAEQGLDARFLRIFRSDQPLALSVNEGSSIPLDRSTIGLAMLAAKDPKTAASVLDRIDKHAGTQRSGEERAHLLDQLEEIRRSGVAIGYGLMSDGIAAVAAALPTGPSGVTYVVSVGGPRERIAENKKDIEAAVRAMLKQVNSHV
jgi:IclR family transcriptional regulator, KDG regulon repressor